MLSACATYNLQTPYPVPQEKSNTDNKTAAAILHADNITAASSINTRRQMQLSYIQTIR